MEASILTSTKKLLGLAEDYVIFDLDIITHINSAFANLTDLGIGPTMGFMIEDKSTLWSALIVPINQISMIKVFVALKVRMLFDPPGTAFLIEAMEQQIKELEWRLSAAREATVIWNPELPLDDIVIDGGSII